jgi:hypothetical protein
LIVTVRLPEAPWVTGRAAGLRLVSVGPAGRTVTVLWRLLPWSAAVTVAVPGATAVIVTVAVIVPAGTETAAGTATTAGFELSSAMRVSLAGAALRVAVSVPLPPTERVRRGGSRALRVGPGQRLEYADAVEVRVTPSGPFNVQRRGLPSKGTRKALMIRPGAKLVG